MDRRVVPGLVAGLAACALALGAFVLRVPFLSVLAGGGALAAVGACLQLLKAVRAAEEEASGAIALTTVRDMQLAAEHNARRVVDADTGLPDGRFFDLAVDSRVAAARRHLWPMTVVLLEIGLAPDVHSERAQTDALAGFAALMRQTLREADIACRTGPRSFGLLLEDTSEEGGVWTAERLQAALSRDVSRICRLTAGVAAYPSHGLSGPHILLQARQALHRASAVAPGRGLGRVEVASADLG
ncbi:MAG TPA: diguanylate cyclase [Acidimicrobiales bacterium]